MVYTDRMVGENEKSHSVDDYHDSQLDLPCGQEWHNDWEQNENASQSETEGVEGNEEDKELQEDGSNANEEGDDGKWDNETRETGNEGYILTVRNRTVIDSRQNSGITYRPRITQ